MTVADSHKTSPLSPNRLDGKDARIAVAQTWARLFLRESDRALRCLTHQMERAAAQTVCAIEQIDPVPTIEGKKFELSDAEAQSLRPNYPVQFVPAGTYQIGPTCSHGDFFQHAKTKVCVHPDCAPQHDALDGHCAEGCPCLLDK